MNKNYLILLIATSVLTGCFDSGDKDNSLFKNHVPVEDKITNDNSDGPDNEDPIDDSVSDTNDTTDTTDNTTDPTDPDVPNVTEAAVAIMNALNIDDTNELSYSLSGTCSEDGQVVSVMIGSIAANADCSGQTWSISGIDVSSLQDGTSILLTADFSNSVGSVATQATMTIAKVESPNDKVYTFDHIDGKCKAQDGEEGRNKDQLVNCGNMNAQTIDGADFRRKDYYGVSIEDTFVTNSRVEIIELVEFEAWENRGTVIDGVTNLLDQLVTGHSSEFIAKGDTLTTMQVDLNDLKDTVDALMLQIENETKAKKRESLERKLVKEQAAYNELKSEMDLILAKRNRHKDFSIYFDGL